MAHVHWERLTIIATERRRRRSDLAADLGNYTFLLGALAAVGLALATVLAW